MNYQTTDRYMQIERGTFMDNGGCGYVLRPSIMHEPDFHPYNPHSFQQHVEPITIRITVIAARHLPKTTRGLTCPFVEVGALLLLLGPPHVSRVAFIPAFWCQ